MTAMDLSDEQLVLAKEAAQREGVSLECVQGPMEDLDRYPNGAFDLVISICAIQYAGDLQAVFRGVSRVLRHGGRFVFSLDHPVFHAVAARELWPADGFSDSYFYRGSEHWTWKPEDDFVFVSYRRPVQDFVNGLADAGFMINRFHELAPKSGDPSEKEHQLELRFPRFMVFSAVKTVG